MGALPTHLTADWSQVCDHLCTSTVKGNVRDTLKLPFGQLWPTQLRTWGRVQDATQKPMWHS